MIKAEKIYKELRKEALQVKEPENYKLYVSDTITRYIRNNIKKIITKELDNIAFDLKIGVLTETQANKLVSIETLILRSL